MTMKGTRFAACALLALGLSGGAMAQDAVDRVALHSDWSVFNPTDPLECFIASAPMSNAATRQGKPVQVRRDDIRFYISSRPSASVSNEIAFTGGYPYKDGSTVTVEIAGQTYELFTEGEWAWPATPEDDAKLIAAMRRGSKAIVTGLSSRGTTTIDTFSLIGFTAALRDSNSRCAGES